MGQVYIQSDIQERVIGYVCEWDKGGENNFLFLNVFGSFKYVNFNTSYESFFKLWHNVTYFLFYGKADTLYIMQI